MVAASKAMKMGDWKTCRSFIINEKMNEWQSVLPFPEADRLRTMLVRKIQKSHCGPTLVHLYCVFIWLHQHGDAVRHVGARPAMVHSVISKMIINEELMASLDQPSQTMVSTAQSPLPSRTWPCSWLRSWAAWWRTSGCLTAARYLMVATSCTRNMATR